MIILFDTVRRQRPVREGGQLVMLDWTHKRVLRDLLIFPTAPDILEDPNPRGNSRGGKGIVVQRGEIWVATYHTILVFDDELRETRRITHPLFAGLHELCATEDGLWATSTAIDAAVCIDLQGHTQRTWWPREEPLLQDRFGLVAAAIDKGIDHRILHLNEVASKSPGHVHLNGVARWEGNTYALLSAYGALVQIGPEMRVLAEGPRLRGGHSPQISPSGHEIAICSSFMKSILFFDRCSGALCREVNLLQFPEINQLADQHPDQPFNASIFVRGLAALTDDRWLVGISPAAILEIDIRRHQLLDLYIHSHDVADAVHGLAVFSSATIPA